MRLMVPPDVFRLASYWRPSVRPLHASLLFGPEVVGRRIGLTTSPVP